MIVAIDGPAGSGKSSTAKEISKQLNWLYLDTGAIYRVITYYFLQNDIQYSTEKKYDDVLENIFINFENSSTQKVFLNNLDITKEIRSTEVTQFVSTISTIPEVREFCVKMQREIAKNSDVVIEGRDIGTKVFPNAEVKIFLTASVEERAKRRFNELDSKNKIDFEQLVEDIQLRDQRDSDRKISPMTIAKDATVIDTSGMNFNEQLTKIRKHIENIISI
jgi:cytidylate kinase